MGQKVNIKQRLAYNYLRDDRTKLNYKTSGGAKTVIVLGCRVKGTKPSLYLYKRCMSAVAYLKENPAAVAIYRAGRARMRISARLCACKPFWRQRA